MSEIPDCSALRAKFDKIRGDIPEDAQHRIGRVLSWIDRAEKEAGDEDARFIFLWIAFNAAYAKEIELKAVKPDEPSGARADFCEYFETLVELDPENRIYNALWEEFSGPVRLLMKCKYVFQPFWDHRNGIEGRKNWEDRFKGATMWFKSVFEKGHCVDVLNGVFDRLYVLRNQLIHGGATWSGDLNRDQVRNGAEIMGVLIRVFVDVMMDNPDRDWGKPFYPRVEVPLD